METQSLLESIAMTAGFLVREAGSAVMAAVIYVGGEFYAPGSVREMRLPAPERDRNAYVPEREERREKLNQWIPSSDYHRSV